MIRLALLSLVLLSVSCAQNSSNERAGIDPKPEVLAPKSVRDSFGIQTPQGPAAAQSDKAWLTIKRSSLEKEMLLQAQVVQLQYAPQFQNLKSRVVAFRLRGNKVYLIEATQGHTVTNDLPQTLILAEFDILSQDENEIALDFNKGMSHLFMAEDWRAQDFSGPKYKLENEFVNVEAKFSYIESAKVVQNSVVIRQIAQVKVPGPNGAWVLQPVEMKYYLQPYAPSQNYKPVKSKDFLKVGFFEGAPLAVAGGEDVVYATRFNPNSPITYAISSNTPAEFKDAVREGILYWNQAFGKEVLKVVDAPAGVVAPDPEYNVVQWINYDAASGAYADAQMDPRSGEILHAQVWMSSAFAYLGKFRAHELYRRLTNPPAKRAAVSLAGFQNHKLCDFDLEEALAHSLDGLAGEVDSAKFLKVSQAYVREVVAHEIGHTLGLRHNFAGSLAANYTLSEREQIIKSYFDNGQAPAGLVVSSSVMEYSRFEESFLNGDQILRKEKAGSYDEKAIQHLYAGVALPANDMPLFCTDSHADTFVDCVRSDAGRSQVEYAKWNTEEQIRVLPLTLLAPFIAAKAPPYGADPVDLDRVTFAPTNMARSILGSRYELIKSLTSAGRTLRIQRQFGTVGTYNQDKVKNLELEYIGNEIKRVGGLPAILSGIDANFAIREYERVEALLENPKYQSGLSADGQPYTFTAEDLVVIKRTAKQVLEKLQEELVKIDIDVLSLGTPPPAPGAPMMMVRALQLVDHEMNDEIATISAQRIRDYTFAVSGEFINGEIGVVEETPATATTLASKTTRVVGLKLPRFLYSTEIRTLATQMLKDGKSANPTWALAEKVKLKKEYSDLLTSSLGGLSIDKIKPEEIAKPLARWVLEAKKVNTTVNGL